LKAGIKTENRGVLLSCTKHSFVNLEDLRNDRLGGKPLASVSTECSRIELAYARNPHHRLYLPAGPDNIIGPEVPERICARLGSMYRERNAPATEEMRLCLSSSSML